MKKLLLVNVLVLSLAACGGDNNKNEGDRSHAVLISTPYLEQTVQDISQLDLDGLQKATADLNPAQSDALAQAIGECKRNRQATVCTVKVKTVVNQAKKQ